MDEFYFIDKPLGISSFDIIRQLRKKFNLKKMGHTGTLDPLATGGMLIATGNYTKLIPYLERETKEYEFIIKLDGTTASLDLAEKVDYLSQEQQDNYKKSLTKEYIQKLLEQHFLGKVTQVPPKYSAIKINGRRAYDLARKGEEVKMKSREIEIFEHEILEYSYPELKLRAKVSAGTYIRTIAGDVGVMLGTGGYLSYLRRTKIGNLDVTDAILLEEVDKKNSISVEKVLNKQYFLENFDTSHLKRLNDGLTRRKSFGLKVNKPYFIYDGRKVTNVIKFDGENTIPIKKIC